jgi:hypothetical protein
MGLLSNMTPNAASKEAALHENLWSEQALGSDMCASLLLAALSA